jgi:hypothetical protein
MGGYTLLLMCYDAGVAKSALLNTILAAIALAANMRLVRAADGGVDVHQQVHCSDMHDVLPFERLDIDASDITVDYFTSGFGATNSKSMSRQADARELCVTFDELE